MRNGRVMAVVLAACLAALSPARAETERRAFFGELHLHTTYSFDAWAILHAQTTPDQAYRFGRGEPIIVAGQTVRRAWPLDFMAVTDHSENLAVMNELDDAKSAFANSEQGRAILKNRVRAFQMFLRGEPVKEIDVRSIMSTAWEREVAAANAHNTPGTFTTFIAYEWSATPQGRYHLHRNVIFKGDRAPIPFSSMDSNRPEDLWTYLEKARADGFDVIAIPHNSNLSNGMTFDWNNSDGRRIDQAYAQRRALNEPLVEIKQNKGASETTPLLSPNDEFANFEIYDSTASLGGARFEAHGAYVREAYGRGLVLSRETGANPFKFGLVGGSDFHNGLSTSDQKAYAGGMGGVDPTVPPPDPETVKRRLGLVEVASPFADAPANGPPAPRSDPTVSGSGGLTGVWAEENTREAIFAAFKRKETFATSGPRIKVRFFGGWGLDGGMIRDADWARQAYVRAVPMGGDLPRRNASGGPSFIVEAAKDPDGANIERLQIIKVWATADGYQERVFNVAWPAETGKRRQAGQPPQTRDTVDLKTATYQNAAGAAHLLGLWRDPDFDPATPAVYYLRAIEIPTPRWTTILAARSGLPTPKDHPPTIQGRAWSSPIWYTPD